MSDFWQVNLDDGKLEPLTQEMIKLAEEKLKINLPEAYIKILQQQNGGYIHFNAHPSNVPTSWADDHVKADHLFGIGDGKEKGILDSEYLIKEWGLPENLVLISGDGHYWIALDYRKCKADPSVIYMEPDTNLAVKLADSFDSFLEGLYVHTTEDVEDYMADEQRAWTVPEMKVAFAGNDELEVAYALDYLYVNPSEHKQFIEQNLINLLKHPKLETKQIAANYAYQYKEMGLLSPECIGKMVVILQKDDEIAYYVDMFFKEP